MANDNDHSAGAGTNWLYHPHFPRNWTRSPLYALARWVNGLAFRDIQFDAAGKAVIKIAEIKGGLSGQTKYTRQTFDEAVHVYSGDLLFSWSGQPETSIDAFWWRGTDGWLNQHVFKVTPRDDLDKNFFFYLLRYLRPNFVGIARNKQTTGLGHVTKRDLENIEIAYPRLDEQLEIAKHLGTLDDKIELNRRTNETLEVIGRTIFKSWFVDFDPVRAKAEGRDPGLPKPIANLFPDKLGDDGIPNGWTAVPLPDLIDVNPKRILRKGEIAPYLDMANMPTQGHMPDAWIDRAFGSGMRFLNGDTLVARITPCLENGKTAFVTFLPDGQTAWGSTEFIVLRPKNPIPAVFAYCLARSEEFRQFAIQKMTGSSGRQRVPSESLSRFAIVKPPNEVFAEFGRLVEPLFARATANAISSRTLASIRDALLPKLLSGEITLHKAILKEDVCLMNAHGVDNG